MSFTAKIDANIQGFEDGLNRAGLLAKQFEKLIKDSTEGIAHIGQKLTDIGAKASIMSAALVAAGGKAFKMAADFQDAMGATDQVFKASSEEIQSWAKNLSSEYGVAKKEALEYANLMGTMLKNIGNLTEQEASKQSQKLVELAGDLTAMYGGTTSEAITALTASLRGINVPIANYGVGINEALVKAKAFEMGIASLTGELSIQERQAATLQLIWEQTADAQGQAAREADSASGSMRALKTEVSNLATEFGQALLPIITPIINALKKAVSAFRTMSPEMQSTIVIVGGLAAAFGPLMLITGKIIAMLPTLKIAFFALTSPIGLVVGAITLLTTAFFLWKGSAEKVITQMELLKSVQGDAIKNTERETGEITTLRKVLNDANSSYNEKKAALDRIKAIVPDYHASLTTEGKLINNNASALDRYVKKLVITEKIKLLAMKSSKAAEDFDAFMADNKSVMRNVIRKQVKGDALLAGEKAALAISTRLAQNVDVINNSIEGLQKQLISIEATSFEEPIVTGFDNIASSAKKAKEEIERIPTNAVIPSISLPALTGLSTAAIDPLRGLSMTEYTEKYRQAAEEIKMITFDMKEYMVDAFVNMWSSIGDALVNGKNVLKSIGSSLLGSLGRVMVDLGKMVLMGGSAIVAIKKALTSLNGPIAIAAGAALIAVGSIFAAGASKLGNSMGSGGGMGGSSSVAGMQTTVTPVTPSYRGSYFDGSEVTFKIGTNELVGVLAMADNRKNRLQ